MKHGLLFLFAFAALASVPSRATCADKPGVQQAARLDTQVKVQMGYLLYLPKEYEKQASWPLLLFLHGGGERGNDLDLVKVHGPPKLIAAGKEFPFIVVSPQCPKDQAARPPADLGLPRGQGRSRASGAIHGNGRCAQERGRKSEADGLSRRRSRLLDCDV